MTRPLVHVGYVKSASSFLQAKVFGEARFGFAEPYPEARLVITDRLQLDDGWAWDESVHRASFAADNEAVASRGLVPVWSEERLLGDPVQNLYGGAVTAERLARVMPDARVLIVVREQRDLALSVYKEVIHDGQALRLVDVIGTGEEGPGFRPRLREDFLRYDRACARYRTLFGEDGVLALPVEMLRADPDGFLRRLQEFAGISDAKGGGRVSRTMPTGRVHVGAGEASLRATRALNRLRRPSPLGHPTRLSDKLVRRAGAGLSAALPRAAHEAAARRMRAVIDARYRGRFAEDNARLAALCGLDLHAYGYEVAA